jgi:microcystin-dependent protein
MSTQRIQARRRPLAVAPPAPARRTFLRGVLAALAGGATLLGRPRVARAGTMPYVGEIMAIPWTFAPAGWLMCNGQIVSIASYETLFYLIGTTYGGDGQFTFGIPDLRGRAPMHSGQGVGLTARMVGEQAGEEAVSLTSMQIPVHAHSALADSGNGSATAPGGRMPARDSAGALHYTATSPGLPMAAGAIGSAGAGQPHENMQPYLAINYCIAYDGVYPSPS